MNANPELIMMNVCHVPAKDKPTTNSGSADPNVNPPIKIPMANPLPFGNHEDMNCTATGYIPARNIPVRNRSINPSITMCTSNTKSKLKIDARAADAGNINRGFNRSCIPKIALNIAPATNPIWTDAVIHGT